jgi:uncharacterized membrane protein
LSPAVLSHPTSVDPHESTALQAAPANEETGGYVPYVPHERASIFNLELAQLPVSAPVTWLKQGWTDFRCCPRTGLFYGLCFFLMGHALWAVFNSAPAYVLALSAGFLLMGPFLCLGLYHSSKEIEQGRHPSLGKSLMAWQSTKGAMGIFAGVLLVLEMIWGRASLIVFAVTFNAMPSADNTLSQLLTLDNLGFLVTYAVVGAFFAGLIFVTSAISIPMIMDRQVDAISAGLTSIRACAQNPGALWVWGVLITTLIGLSMLPFFLGLLVVGPVIGHATWHAYRAIVPSESVNPDAMADGDG